MKFKDIFVHPEEKRLRLIWRLILSMIIFVGSNAILLFVVGLVGSIILMVRDGVGDPMALTERLMSMPIMTALTGLASLLSVMLMFFIMVKFIDKKSFKDYGLDLDKQWWRDLVFGLALGAVLMLIIFVVELSAGWITIIGRNISNGAGTFAGNILIYFIFFICVGIYEEVLFRGYQMTTGAQGFANTVKNQQIGLFLAWFISSAVFGLAHASNPNATVISSIGIFLAGMLLLGVGFVLTGRLGISIGVHITWNFFQGNVFGFPVSGLTDMPSFFGIQQGGNDLITGGAFGPEAGLIGLFAMILGAGLTMLYVRWQYGEVKLHLPLAAPPIAAALAVVELVEIDESESDEAV